MPNRTSTVVSLLLLIATHAAGRDVDGLIPSVGTTRDEPMGVQQFTFDGYKNYWARDAWQWNTARGLFAQSQQTPEAALWSMEAEIGKALMLEELWVQPGFIQQLAGRAFTLLERPSDADFWTATASTLLVSTTDQDAVGKALVAKLPEEWQFRRNRAFYLEDGDGLVFVLACHTPEELTRLKALVEDTLAVVRQYDFHRGLAGVTSNYIHITPDIGRNPFELIQIARSLGCDWMSVDGYNDWMVVEPTRRALAEVGDPFLIISGQGVSDGAMYGLERYPDVQDNTVEQCLQWAEEHGGFYLANLSAADGDYASRFQAFLAGSPTDVARIQALDAPFLTRAGDIDRNVPPTTVVFLEKGTALTQESLFAAIKARQAVAVYPEGVVAGPETLVRALQFLLLEGAVLEEGFGGGLEIAAHITEGKLSIRLHNTGTSIETAELTLRTGAGLQVDHDGIVSPARFALPSGRHTEMSTSLAFTPEAGGHHNLVAIEVTAERAAGSPSTVRALAAVEVPPVTSFQTLRYETPGTVTYPVSLWNNTEASRVTMTFVVQEKTTGEEVHRTERTVQAVPWQETRLDLTFDVVAGDYTVEAIALGATTTGQLAVREAPGAVKVYESDLDGDGMPEVILESETIRVALLMEGGRVIEYILKETGENIFFKLWPETPPLHDTVGGTRSFYPYGGLEEFIGYPYIGGHIAYHYEILQDSGDKGRVRVWANIHGSKISKVYTLYAGGPVLEAAYQFQDMTPTIQTIGINPLFELGPSTGPEDRYYFPEETLVETRPELERYYGRACFPKEGWAAGADPEAGVSLVIGYPANDAVYLHLWNNHPNNTPTPYYYTEIQPWLQFNHGTTTYFSYYVLGSTDDWKVLAQIFRDAGLVTKRENPAPWDY